MSVSTVTNRVTYQGDGTSALFAFQYPIQSPSDLSVFTFNSSVSPAAVQALTLNAAGPFGFTVAGNQNQSGVYPNGASVTFNSSPNAQTVVTIFRSSAVVNNFFVSQTGTIPSSGLNNELDLLTLIAQRLQDQVTRSVRVHDGFAGQFDPTLPVDFKAYPLKPLVLNSTCTGFIFDPTAGSYIPNTVIIAVSSTAIGSLGGAGTGFYLQSNGSSPPTWGNINISSAAVSAGAIVGVLPQSTGGTGNTSYILGGLIFQETPTQFGSISAVAPPGYMLTTNSGAAPSFQAFSATSINSGVIAVANGGTGVNQILPQYALLVASSATEVGTVPSATNGWFLRSGGSSAPAFAGLQTTDILTGIFGVARGGTGTGTSYIQYGVMFASSATQMANTQAGGGDIPLVGNPAAAPSFRALNLASGSSVTGTLPTTNGGTGLNSYISGSIHFGSSTTAVGQAVVGVNQVMLGGGSSAPGNVLGYGSSTHVLTSNGQGAAPTWQPAASVAPTYNAFSASTTGNIPITGSSTNIPMTTTNVDSANGKTGSSTYTIQQNGIFEIVFAGYFQPASANAATGLMRLLRNGVAIGVDIGVGTGGSTNNTFPGTNAVTIACSSGHTIIGQAYHTQNSNVIFVGTMNVNQIS